MYHITIIDFKNHKKIILKNKLDLKNNNRVKLITKESLFLGYNLKA